jgi:hypothetical protein
MLLTSNSVIQLEKTFFIEQFLSEFSIPNKKLSEIKQMIIDTFVILKTNKLIENKFELIYKNGEIHETIKLTVLQLTRTRQINFYETSKF